MWTYLCVRAYVFCIKQSMEDILVGFLFLHFSLFKIIANFVLSSKWYDVFFFHPLVEEKVAGDDSEVKF